MRVRKGNPDFNLRTDIHMVRIIDGEYEVRARDKAWEVVRTYHPEKKKNLLRWLKRRGVERFLWTEDDEREGGMDDTKGFYGREK